jgi:2-dehydropantoate 2-reductase
MRHGVLGAGGVGGFLGGALARAGREVVLLMRPEALAEYDGRLSVESAVLGDFELDVPATAILDRAVDVLWVTPKATQLDEALGLVPVDRLGGAVVVPLLNGLDHVAVLRTRLGADRVVAGAIAVESERVGVGKIRQKTAFAEVTLAPDPRAAQICAELTDAGLGGTQGASEAAVLWRKLALLAPIALTTTALEAPLSAVVGDPTWRLRLEACVREVAAVAAADGVEVDADAALSRYEQIGDLRSSMQKDRAAGLPLELDAIGGAVLRAARRHGIDAPTTQELVELIEGPSEGGHSEPGDDRRASRHSSSSSS